MFETYKQAEAFLQDRERLGIKPGLQRINRLLADVCHPEKKVLGIHVAGTNGKGSTVQFLTNALIKNKYRVGTFTSPSMYGLRGHIMLQNDTIGEDVFTDLLNAMLPVIKKMDDASMAPTAFEIITALAFLYFAENVDIAIVEAGMGGREDTTNCFVPILSIITNIALDHTDFLGDTVAEIASHKAGIIKENTPVITGELPNSAKAVIKAEAAQKGAALYSLNKDFKCERIKSDQLNHFVQFEHDGWETSISLQMYGAHQEKNAALAVMAMILLRNNMQFLIEIETALNGISCTTVAGRFEKINDDPVIIVDSAHNPAGIKAFLQTVEEFYPGQQKKLLFAGFKDKDLKQMLQKCIGNFEEIILTSFVHPRAIKAEELKDMFPDEKLYAEEDYHSIVDSILQENKSKTVYFIAGSFHFIADIKDYLARIL